jgi:hypothetical protein
MLTWISTNYLGDVAVFKFNASGDSLWRELYDFGHSELSSRMEFTPDNNLAIMAYGNQQPDNWYSDWITLKVDLDGNLLWSKRYDHQNGNDELPQMMMVDNDNNIFVTGIAGPWPGGSNLGERQMVVIKYNADGDSVWSAAIDTFTEYNTGIGMVTDSENGLYVLGGDYSILIHYDDTSTTITTELENTFHSNAVNIFPNPANERLSIVSETEIMKTEIFDAVGRNAFVSDKINSRRFDLNLADWQNGFYVIRLTGADKTTWYKFLKE